MFPPGLGCVKEMPLERISNVPCQLLQILSSQPWEQLEQGGKCGWVLGPDWHRPATLAGGSPGALPPAHLPPSPELQSNVLRPLQALNTLFLGLATPLPAPPCLRSLTSAQATPRDSSSWPVRSGGTLHSSLPASKYLLTIYSMQGPF